MKARVVYDSVFGNTEQIARAIGSALGSPEDVEVLRVGDAAAGQMAGLQLLIVGSPTRGFRPTPAITNWLKSIPVRGLRGVRVSPAHWCGMGDVCEAPQALRSGETKKAAAIEGLLRPGVALARPDSPGKPVRSVRYFWGRVLRISGRHSPR